MIAKLFVIFPCANSTNHCDLVRSQFTFSDALSLLEQFHSQSSMLVTIVSHTSASADRLPVDMELTHYRAAIQLDPTWSCHLSQPQESKYCIASFTFVRKEYLRASRSRVICSSEGYLLCKPVSLHLIHLHL